jgi:hypothetical protein
MNVHVVSKLPAASTLNSHTCLLGGGVAVVDFLRTECFVRILWMMKTDTPKHVNIYEKKMRYGRVLVSAPSGGGVRFM